MLQEEMEWRRINEHIELETEGVEPLLASYAGYSGDVRTFLPHYLMW